jgi:hypothetical protein
MQDDKEGKPSAKKKHKQDGDDEQNTEPVVFPNTPANAKEFGWCKHGEDQVRAGKKGGKKQPNEETYLKVYYICSEKKKGGTCGAKKRVHHLLGGDNTECVGTHNHPPPLKTDPEVEKKIEEQLRVGAKPSVIHSRMINDAHVSGQPITPKNVPTKQKIYNMQHKIAMAELPTGTCFYWFLMLLY